MTRPAENNERRFVRRSSENEDGSSPERRRACRGGLSRRSLDEDGRVSAKLGRAKTEARHNEGGRAAALCPAKL